MSSRAAVSCAIASVVASSPSRGVSPAGRMSAAVVLTHGVVEGLACRRELGVDAAVVIALSAAEMPAASVWPVLAVLASPDAPSPAPVAAVVSAGSGVELVLVSGVGDGELEVGVGSGEGDGEVDDGLDEVLADGLGSEKWPFGLWDFLHAGVVAELCGWLDEGPGDPEPSAFARPDPTGFVGPELMLPEFFEVPTVKRAEPLSPTYAPAATTKIARLRAASGRSHLSARPRSGTESGPNRCQIRRIPCASSGPAVCSAARARRKKSVQAASSQAMATGRGRRSLAWMRSRPSGAGSILAAALCKALRSAASRSLSVLTRHAPARFEVPASPWQCDS